MRATDEQEAWTLAGPPNRKLMPLGAVRDEGLARLAHSKDLRGVVERGDALVVVVADELGSEPLSTPRTSAATPQEHLEGSPSRRTRRPTGDYYTQDSPTVCPGQTLGTWGMRGERRQGHGNGSERIAMAPPA